MPVNGMLTLMDVVDAGQQGVEWKQQQDEQARIKKQRDLMESADREASGVIEASKAEWALNGAQGEYRPNDGTMLKAAEARGLALARGGDWSNFAKNEAAVQQQRQRVRASALQQYGVDGDVDRLVRTAYPTVFDGKEIVGTEVLKGSDVDAQKGAPSGPTKLRIKFNDGNTEIVEPDKLVQRLKMTLVDPEKQAMNDFQLSVALAKARIEAEGKKDVERTKGEEDRKTEGVKADKQIYLADAKNETAVEVAETRAGATLGAAKTRAGASAGGGGAGGSGGRLQSTKTDADGYIVGVYRDGTTKRLTDGSGKPVRSGDWSKRVDDLAKTLAKSPDNFNKPAGELRKQAEAALADAAPQNPQASGGKDYSNLWK